MICRERVLELLDYSPITGVFTWKQDRSRNAKAGGVAGNINDKGYIKIKIDGKLYSAHRLVYLVCLGYLPEKEVDHINGHKHDNRFINLREVGRKQNQQNTGVQKNNKIGVKGITFHRGKYRVTMNVDGKQKYLGKYDNLEMAELAAKEARLKYHGEYAKS